MATKEEMPYGWISLPGATIPGNTSPYAAPAQNLSINDILTFLGITGFTVKIAVDVATTAALTATYDNGSSGVGATLTLTATGALTIDGHVVLLNERVLVKNQADATQNGPYTCTVQGATGVSAVLTRSTDSDTGAELLDGLYFVTLGSVNANLGFYLTNSSAPVIGTDNLTYAQYASGGSGNNNSVKAGTGISKSGSTLSVIYGTTAGSAVQGNDSRFYNVPAVTVTAAAYTLLVTDRGKVVETTNNSGVALTIDPSIFGAGDIGEICQVGTGIVTLTPAAGVTFLSAGGLTKTTTIGAAVGWRIRNTGSVALNGTLG